MRIAIVGGAGGIGSSVAYSLVLSGVGSELVLIDRDEAVLRTQVMDLEQLRVDVRDFQVRAGSLDDLRDADVVVVSASVPAQKDLPRMAYLAANRGILDTVVEGIGDGSDWPGVVIIATNPVDPLVTSLQRRTGIDRKRVLGYTINDSLRLRYGIAEAMSLRPEQVTAWVIGEHGERAVPLFSRVSIDGEPADLDEPIRDQARRYLFEWYPAWVALGVRRTSTWTSGHGIARMVKGVVDPDGATWACSFVSGGEYGIEDVAVGLPVELGRGGVEGVRDWELTPEESDAMQAAGAFVRESLTEMDAGLGEVAQDINQGEERVSDGG
jgi:malate dehydrogenase